MDYLHYIDWVEGKPPKVLGLEDFEKMIVNNNYWFSDDIKWVKKMLWRKRELQICQTKDE